MAGWLADSLGAVYKEEKVIRLRSPPQLTGF